VLLDYFMPGMEPIKCVNTVVDKAGTSIAVFLLTAADNAAARAANLRCKRLAVQAVRSIRHC
jgi:CheY-like chemotaxis protein